MRDREWEIHRFQLTYGWRRFKGSMGQGEHMNLWSPGPLDPLFINVDVQKYGDDEKS